MLSLTNKQFLNLVIILCTVKLNNGNVVEISSISRVSKNNILKNNQSNEESRDNKFSIQTNPIVDTTKNNPSEYQTNQRNDDSESFGGRAMKDNNFVFKLPNFITNPVKKQGRYIPSYNPNIINQVEQKYYKPSFPIGQVAQKRFSPSEAYAGTLYKVKHPEKFNGYQYPKPPNDLPMKPSIQPQYLPPDMPMKPSIQPQYLPPVFSPQLMKQSKFIAPIVVADFTMKSPPVSHFLPTKLPQVDSKIGKSENDLKPFAYNLKDFEKNINTSYLPPELNAVKDAMDINNQIPTEIIDSSENKNDEHDTFDLPFSKDLNKFPPNIESSYDLSSSKEKDIELVNSYVPPPSGDHLKMNSIEVPRNNEDLTEMYKAPKDLHVFPPNINSYYLPVSPQMAPQLSLFNSYLPSPSGDESDKAENNDNNLDLTSNYLPPYPLTSLSQPSEPPSMSTVGDDMHDIIPYSNNEPPGTSDMSNNPMMMMMSQPQMEKPDLPPTAMDGPPPGMDGMDSMSPPENFDPHDHDHHHDHHHDHFPWDSYPDISYDDHHHHHHHVEEETTTVAAPEEPRVKKYSYYYLGRKLWYIPLYFTFWFCLYVAALIIRSIGRHKVDLPNHYQRSLHDLSHNELVEKIDKMTEFAMYQIEDFKQKYL